MQRAIQRQHSKHRARPSTFSVTVGHKLVDFIGFNIKMYHLAQPLELYDTKREGITRRKREEERRKEEEDKQKLQNVDSSTKTFQWEELKCTH